MSIAAVFNEVSRALERPVSPSYSLRVVGYAHDGGKPCAIVRDLDGQEWIVVVKPRPGFSVRSV